MGNNFCHRLIMPSLLFRYAIILRTKSKEVLKCGVSRIVAKCILFLSEFYLLLIDPFIEYKICLHDLHAERTIANFMHALASAKSKDTINKYSIFLKVQLWSMVT